MADSKFKTRVKAQAGVQLPAEAVSRALTVDGSGDIKSSSVTTTELGYVSGVTSSIQTQLTNTSNGLSDHLNDTTDAHDASAISNIPSGNLAATDVQSALNELQSDVDSRALDSVVIKKDGSVAFTAAQSMGGFKLTNLADPTANGDAVNLGYMNARLNGLTPKAPVRAATLVAGTLATSFENGDVIDGVTLVTGNRILIKNQVAPEQNGIYIVQASGAPVRSADMDAVTPFDEFNGAWTAVQEGTQAGQVFVQYGTVTTVGTDAVNFAYYNPIAGLIGGDMITFAGSTFSVDLASAAGLESTNPGNAAGQLQVKLDGTTLSKSASGLKVNSITSAEVSDFNEAAQDAVGNILTDSSKIDFTYNDAGNTITATIVADSLVNADINSAAAIALTKLAATTASRALVSDASGFITASAVTSTELGYVSGVTSAIQTQLNGKASTTLNNLGTTSINANLLPDAAGTRNVGSNTLPWANVTSNVLNATSIGLFNTIGGTAKAVIDATTSRTAPSGIGDSELTIYAPNLASDIGIYGGDPTGANGGSVFVETYNRTGSNTSGLLNLQTGSTVNGNSGAINLVTGTPSGSGTRADISLDGRSVVVKSGSEVRFNNTANTFYTSLKTGTNTANLSLTLPIADGTSGQVLQTNGSGVLTFVTPAAGYTDEQAQDAVGNILTDSTTIDFTYNDAGNTITAIVIDGSITNAKVASGIDAVKIADGSVSNTEFQYLDGVTSSIQTQLNGKVATQAGDIALTSFAAADGQATPANITGFAFANASVRSFKALVSVTSDATADLFESFELLGVQKGSTWDLSQSAVGDDSGVVLSITNVGQVQYTSVAAAGFVSLTIKFRAIVTTV